MKIGALIPVWNQERFIGQHIKMLQNGVDKIVVLFEPAPLGSYQKEYDVGLVKDRTEEIVKSFPDVEYHNANYRGEFMAALFNEGLKYVQDCDLVFKLDPDCFFTDKDWARLIEHMRNHDHDCYQINCKTNSINYYVTGRFDIGIRNGGELHEVYAFDPKKELHGVTSYDAARSCLVDESWGDFTMHHFKGWKKPFTEEWLKTWQEPNDYEILKAPQEIIDKLS